MRNYFNYFTEIEEHFQRRRGSLLLLSNLDWALIETWREAGVPLEAVFRGIDAAFDKHDARKSGSRHRRVNGLAYCAQAVLSAAEDLKEAAVGAAPSEGARERDGFDQKRIAAHLAACAMQLRSSAIAAAVAEIAHSVEELAAETAAAQQPLEHLEAKLTALEKKLLAIALASTPDDEVFALRQLAAAELAPYRSRMQALQIRQLEQQMFEKRLMEKLLLPRLSLFYMGHA